MSRAPGDSAEQREAERLLIQGLSERLGVKLERRRLALPGGAWFEVDGFSEAPPIICEAWAHVGPPKSAQKHKVLADAFKLLYAARRTAPAARKILIFADQEAAVHFQGKSWMARALRDCGIEVATTNLPEGVRQRLRDAQQRQFR